jgi:Kef-type K+ transport system membrane component KefB
MYLLELAVLLLWAKIGGFISDRLGQPSVLGQMIVGIILGPMALGLLHETEVIRVFADLGVIFLMFIAGLETDVSELKESGRTSAVIAILGVVLPMGLGMAAARLIGYNPAQSLFIGVVLTATSVSISVQSLRDMNKLQSREGIAIIGAAVIDDVLGIILLTLTVSMVSPGLAQGSLVTVIVRMAIFFALTGALGYMITKILTRYSSRFTAGDRIVTIAIALCLMTAFYAEEAGVAAITGAYFVGIVFSTTQFRNKVSYNIQKIAYSTFTPVFFIGMGLRIESGGLGKALSFGLLLTLVGIIGKVAGCGFGARLSGFESAKALQVGVGMIPRGEVALIIADIGLRMKVAGSGLVGAIVLMVVITTVITPPLLKFMFDRDDKSDMRTGK